MTTLGNAKMASLKDKLEAKEEILAEVKEVKIKKPQKAKK